MTTKVRKPKAADISDVAMIVTIAEQQGKHGVPQWATVWDVWEALPEFPHKVVRAKLQSMKRRGIIDGCFHLGTPCRGDIEFVGGQGQLDSLYR